MSSQLVVAALSWIPLAGGAAVVDVPLGESSSAAQQTHDAVSQLSPGGPLGPSASERAAQVGLESALTWLAARQSETNDGSFPTGDADQSAPVATTALATLAFLAAGHTPERGPFAHELRGALEYLVARSNRERTSPSFGYLGSRADSHSRMHGHGFATLALAQAYGLSPRSRLGKRLEDVLTAAVRLIERTQGAEGGWWYEPERSTSHEGSITICLVQALRAARNAGLVVDRDVIQRAEDYVRRSQKDDGTFRYMIGMERSSAALTAAAIATLNAVGDYDDPMIGSATDALWRELTARDLAGESAALPEWPYYERLYIAQAFWQHRDRTHFERWIEEERRGVLSRQEALGSWRDRRFGRSYATAMNALFLALPGGVLPIFQR